LTSSHPRPALVTALLLVGGLGFLVLGLQWYWGYVGRLSGGSPPQPLASPSDPTTPLIAALASTSAHRQRAAALTLASLGMTPELELAIRSASPADESAQAAVQCLKARLPDLVSLDSLVAHLPSRNKAVSRTRTRVDETTCFASVLSTRVREDPLRVVRALLPLALSAPARIGGPTLAAVEDARLPEIPPDILRQLREGWNEGMNIRAAIALRADELAPQLLEEWLRSSDTRVRQSARHFLVRAPRPSAIRLVVRAAADLPDDRGFFLTLRGSGRDRDVGSVLADQALDASEPLAARLRALEFLAELGSVSQLAALDGLLVSPDPELRAYAEAAASALRNR